MIYAVYTDKDFLGTHRHYANVSVYANGGAHQPNCDSWHPICNHFMSDFFFVESLRGIKYTITSNTTKDVFGIHGKFISGNYEMETTEYFPYDKEF